MVIWSHFTLLTDPNNFFLKDSGDGFKNYFTVIYHVKHDSTYSHFQGMNYPYGEQVVFTDNQPLISNGIKFISNNFIDISGHTVGIINYLMLISIVLSCFFLYQIFRKFHIPEIWAVLFASGIGFMAPQIHRMMGHYAPAYGFVIPLLILLWLRFKDQSTVKNSLVLAVLILLASLLHMYYFALCGAFLILYLLFTLMINRNREQLKFAIRHGLIQIGLPLLFLMIWFYFTDSVTDRPADPYGFLVFKAVWRGIFLPIGYPLGSLIHSVYPIKEVEWQGIAYIGVIPGVFFIKYAFSSMHKFVKSKGKDITGIQGDTSLNYLLFISLFILLFSLRIPFIFNLEFLVEYLGPLKQFRGIARFAWVFYFGMCIVGFIMFYRWVNHKFTNENLRLIILIAGAGWLHYEANLFHNMEPFYELTTIPALQDKSNPSYHPSPILKVQAEAYQAILPLPYFHIGSENIFGKDPKSTVARNTMVASIISGLPSIGVMMSRTSLSQTLKNLNLVLEPYGPYNVFQDYPSSKPILLWIQSDVKLNRHEKALANLARVVYRDREVTLSELHIQGFYNGLNHQYWASREESRDSSLYPIGGFMTTDSVLNFYHEYEIDEDGGITKWATEIGSGNIRDTNVIFEGLIPEQDAILYTLSLSVKFAEDLHPTTRLMYDEWNVKGELIHTESRSYGELIKLLDYNWALIEFKFTPHAPGNRLRFSLTKDTYHDMVIKWNDLLIRPAKNDIYYVRDGDVVYKNGRMYGVEYFLMDGEVIGQNAY